MKKDITKSCLNCLHSRFVRPGCYIIVKCSVKVHNGKVIARMMQEGVKCEKHVLKPKSIIDVDRELQFVDECDGIIFTF